VYNSVISFDLMGLKSLGLPPLCRHEVRLLVVTSCSVMIFISGNKKPDNLEPKRRDYRAPQNGDIKEKQWH